MRHFFFSSIYRAPPDVYQIIQTHLGITVQNVYQQSKHLRARMVNAMDIQLKVQKHR